MDRTALPSEHWYGDKDTLSESNAARVQRGELPERYAQPWFRPLFEAARPALSPGAHILDVGAGRDPLLSVAARPESSTYVGLDVEASELEIAGPSAYDETVVGDIAEHIPDFDGRFDLIMSWQVLEHVARMDLVIENMRSYLRPGGRMVAQLSGRFAVYALLGRLLPYRASQWLMATLLSADPEEKFPTRYESCDAASLSHLLTNWTEFKIIPRYRAATYFSFWRPLEKLYLAYEDWTIRSGRANLATHYLVWAVK